MHTHFEYTVVDESFDLFTDQTPHNRAWVPFSFDIRRLPTGDKIWIRRRLEEMGPGYILNIHSGNDDLSKYTGSWPVGDWQGLPPPHSVNRRGMYMIDILVRPVVDADISKLLSLTKNTLQHGNVRIDASGAISGIWMWSETYGARESVRCIELRNKIQADLVAQGTLTRSSPIVRLLMDDVVVRGNKILKHPTEFGKMTPAHPQYPKTQYRNTICRFLKRA